VRRIAEFAEGRAEGEWITGGDWDHTLWGGQLPARDWIDEVTPNNPVWINRLDGHMALANSAALAVAGVSDETAEVEGGTIVRDESGAPTGVLKDNAMQLVERAVPSPTDVQYDQALDAAMDYLVANGVTSVHHLGSWEELAVLERARQSGRLRIRVYAAVPLATWQQLRDKVEREGRGDEWLRIGGLKGFVDGSLGSHTAAFLDPYQDQPQDRGLLVNTGQDLYRWARDADAAGLHVMVHAIGDRANRMQLDLFERIAAENGPRDRRWRIEHAQHIAAADIPRFAQLGVIASMQPYHAIDDGRWAEPLIGAERAETSYAFRSLLDSGGRLAFGSDWYVAPATPLEGIYAAATRQTLDGKSPNGWVPSQKISPAEALRAYTADAAYASFEEDLKGTLVPGKLADFVVLDRDITRVSPEQIRQTRISATYIAGRRVYDRNHGIDLRDREPDSE
jgi:predicted amidohydrolase YtcJ